MTLLPPHNPQFSGKFAIKINNETDWATYSNKKALSEPQQILVSPFNWSMSDAGTQQTLEVPIQLDGDTLHLDTTCPEPAGKEDKTAIVKELTVLKHILGNVGITDEVINTALHAVEKQVFQGSKRDVNYINTLELRKELEPKEIVKTAIPEETLAKLEEAFINNSLEAFEEVLTDQPDLRHVIFPEGKTLAHYAVDSEISVPALDLITDMDLPLNEPSNDGTTPAMIAASKGNTDALQYLINKHLITVDTSSELFELAQQNEQLPVTELLIETFSADLANINGSVVYQALIDGQIDTVKAWIKAGYDINTLNMNTHSGFNSTQHSLAHHAACEGDTEILRTLKELGADMNVKDSYPGNTPARLMMLNADDGYSELTKEQRLEVIQCLHELGADSTITTEHGYNTVHMSFLDGDPNMISFLLEAGINFKEVQDGSNGLFDRIGHSSDGIERITQSLIGDLDNLRAFKEQGVNLSHVQDQLNKSIIPKAYIAMEKNELETLKDLKELGFKLKGKEIHKLATEKALAAIQGSDMTTLETLKELGFEFKGCELPLIDETGTLAHQSASSEDWPTLKLLHELGFKLDQKNRMGQRPLDLIPKETLDLFMGFTKKTRFENLLKSK